MKFNPILHMPPIKMTASASYSGKIVIDVPENKPRQYIIKHRPSKDTKGIRDINTIIIASNDHELTYELANYAKDVFPDIECYDDHGKLVYESSDQIVYKIDGDNKRTLKYAKVEKEGDTLVLK